MIYHYIVQYPDFAAYVKVTTSSRPSTTCIYNNNTLLFSGESTVEIVGTETQADDFKIDASKIIMSWVTKNASI